MGIGFGTLEERCSGCGLCVADCPPHILELAGGRPRVKAGREEDCYRCQHCFTICPRGAVSILGLRPEASESLAGPGLEPRQLETLVKGRRSVRRYLDEDLDPALVQRLLESAWHAPTGVNRRALQFTVVDDRVKMARVRQEVLAGLAGLIREGALPEGMDRYREFVRLWEEEGVDVLFRGAPHLLVISVSAEAATPVPDGLIAMATFDLLAQAHGVGTLWDGLATRAIEALGSGIRATLGIPEDHRIGYAMVFGKAAVSYARTAQRTGAVIRRMP